MMTRPFPLVLLCLMGCLRAAHAQPWHIRLYTGCQYASPAQPLGHFTDALRGSPRTGLHFGTDMAFFWKYGWGLYATARFSQSGRDWPSDLQRAFERDYPGQLVRIAQASGPWDASVSQGFMGIRHRRKWKGVEWQPSAGIGFTETWAPSGGADIKTPDSHALLNVTAYPAGKGRWHSAFSAELGLLTAWPVYKRLHLTAAAYYDWVKPSLSYHWSETDQVSATLRSSQLRYTRPQHLLGISLGLGVELGKRRKEEG